MLSSDHSPRTAIRLRCRAGSKPELLAVVAMTDADTPIICNGFKDAEFIRMALRQGLGRGDSGG